MQSDQIVVSDGRKNSLNSNPGSKANIRSFMLSSCSISDVKDPSLGSEQLRHYFQNRKHSNSNSNSVSRGSSLASIAENWQEDFEESKSQNLNSKQRCSKSDHAAEPNF